MALARLLETRAPAAVVLIRLMVGAVFLSEGIQKFLFPEKLGAGRFAQIGIPAPAFFGPFVGAVEVACGALLLVGLLTRVAAIPLLADMAVAIATTKLPLLAQATSRRQLGRAMQYEEAHLGQAFKSRCLVK